MHPHVRHNFLDGLAAQMIRLFKGTIGNDTLLGSSGVDYMYGDTGDDYLRGAAGTDFLRGSFGNDILDGGRGHDFLESGEDNDSLIGGLGRDILLGQSGDDVLDGGEDNDTISGGTDKDVLTGGTGADRFVFISIKDSTPGARDLITDFDPTSGDLLDFSSIDAKPGVAGGQNFVFIGSAAFTAAGQIRATIQDGLTLVEVNTAGAGKAEMVIELSGTLTLLAEHFRLTGSVNTDDATHNVRLGTEGNDILDGGGGEDYLYGNAGDDILRGGGDSDLVRAGEGNDWIDGGAGDDGLYGGDGADTFVVSAGYDILQDFELGIDGIQVDSLTINSFEQLTMTLEVGGSLIAITDLGMIYVAGIAPSSLHASDFIFT
jgi:Ca2+-binding RTX toxin-like protein